MKQYSEKGGSSYLQEREGGKPLMSTCGMEGDKRERPKHHGGCLFALGELYSFSASKLPRILTSLTTLDRKFKVEINY